MRCVFLYRGRYHWTDCPACQGLIVLIFDGHKKPGTGPGFGRVGGYRVLRLCVLAAKFAGAYEEHLCFDLKQLTCLGDQVMGQQ